MFDIFYKWFILVPTTTTTTTTTFAPIACANPVQSPQSSPVGVQNNVNQTDILCTYAYELIYFYPYSHAVSSEEINSIRSRCTASTELCVACSVDSSGSVLSTVACGNCYTITAETALNTPGYSNGVYWYNTPSQSFGLSADPTISQGSADTASTNPEKRISWHIGSGGYRCGTEYTGEKHIYIKN